MRRYSLCVAFLLWTIAFSATGMAASPLAPAPERVAAIAEMLPEQPRGLGAPITDRDAWERLAGQQAYQAVVAYAEDLVKTPMPEMSDETYLDFSRTGNRTRGQRVISQRRTRLNNLVTAECLENQGRFLPAIEEAIRSICSEKAWCLPAHDGKLRNFRGEVSEIDLVVAGLSWNLATAHCWLGEKLSPEVRTLLLNELERRTFAPYESSLSTGEPRLWWITGTSNWNAVCQAGVIGAALAAIESRERRAFFLAAAEKNLDHFLRGFTDDGYCSEGMGYWNYGFGHYVLLAETSFQATGGGLDLLAQPKVREIALFGPHMEIVPEVYPAFADCRPGSRPAVWILAFLDRKLGLGLAPAGQEAALPKANPRGDLFEIGLFAFGNSATDATREETVLAREPRHWFPDAHVLIVRPGLEQSRVFGAAMKGGHNAEHHNHNDVGTYVVALGKATPLVDPGGEVYTARTFSSRRYESDVLNSFGHSVPRVAGQLQVAGRKAAATVLKTDFSPAADRLVLDLKAAYAVPELQKLQRTFVFSREGSGSLTVEDEVCLSEPQAFETALVTLGDWEDLGNGRLRFRDGGEAVDVRIDAGDADYRIEATRLEEDLGKREATRIGISLVQPVEKAVIRLVITPGSD